MSPASQGALEVERYIGSCLISSTGRPSLQKPIGGCRKQEQQGGLRVPKQQQQQQQQCQNQFGPVGTWAGGAPLISMASNPRRNNQRSSPGQASQQQQQQQQLNHQSASEQLPAHLHNRVPLSRLAVHTQGAPLILSGRFHNNRAKIHNGQSANSIANCVAGLLNGSAGNGATNGNSNISSLSSNATRCHPSLRLNKPVTDQKKQPQQQQQSAKTSDASKDSTTNATTNTTTTTNGANVANIDSLSIASDESSGSNNSENSLPRIIKPRKRRKKDRKPPVVSVVNPANAVPSTNDAKVTEELQQQTMPLAMPVNSSIISEQQQQQSHHQLKSYSINSYDGNARYNGDNYYKGHRRPGMNNHRESAYGRSAHPSNNCSSVSSTNNSTPSNPQQEVVDTRQSQQQQQQQQRNGAYAHRHVQVKVLDDNRNVILPVPVCQAKAAASYLRHNSASMPAARFLRDYEEPVTLTCHHPDSGIDDCLQSSALCQCHYCDPATLIWDVADQNGFSPPYMTQASPDFAGIHHHHHHHHRYSQVPVFLTRPFVCQEHANALEFFDIAENSCLRVRTSERPDGTAILRRSWSDPTSYFSDEIVPNRDVGVIGDRGQSGDSPKGRSSWRGDASTAMANSPSGQPSSPGNGSSNGSSPGLQGPLEVSTEIVTSPNGHRDLEIKFYSSSPTSYPAEEAKNAFAFPEDDNSHDSEEFSDIWSYHESKLQQDFRTLLQAEE